ncbi:MAG: hypothetical protein K0R09_3198 [Clostridiales bacterium]|nr:hypothetical protein [Clostridiales bacterium]
MARKNTSGKKIQYLDAYEEDEDGFTEGDVKTDKVLASFSFVPKPDEQTAATVQAIPASIIPAAAPVASDAEAHAKAFMFSETFPKANGLTDNRKNKTAANTATPPVDSEPHTVNRFYKLRYSTAKMLNEIKASHPDVNVYMNSIVDEAIRHYYSFVFKK